MSRRKLVDPSKFPFLRRIATQATRSFLPPPTSTSIRSQPPRFRGEWRTNAGHTMTALRFNERRQAVLQFLRPLSLCLPSPILSFSARFRPPRTSEERRALDGTVRPRNGAGRLVTQRTSQILLGTVVVFLGVPPGVPRGSDSCSGRRWCLGALGWLGEGV